MQPSLQTSTTKDGSASMMDESFARFVDEMGLDASQLPSLANDVPSVAIPELPRGKVSVGPAPAPFPAFLNIFNCLQVFQLRVYSTWGDPHYVGMSGIEFFDETGRPVTFKNRKVRISMSRCLFCLDPYSEWYTLRHPFVRIHRM